MALHLQVQAGFANRIRSLISGICLAEDLQRTLYVYWNSHDAACAIPFETIFALDTLPSFVKVMDGHLANTKECLSTSDKDRILREWDQTSDLYLRSYGIFYRPEKWLEHLRKLKPTEEIAQKVDSIFPPFDTERILGVHIRRGDNVKSIQASPLNKFLERMDTLDSFFVVATDDAPIKEHLLNRYPSRIVFPSKTLNRNTKEGMLDAMVDFFCLARCLHILGSAHSSFNEIAALYGNCELERVI